MERCRYFNYSRQTRHFDKAKNSSNQKKLRKKEGKHFGINIIDKFNAVNPIMPSISLDGKTLQTLLEAKKFPQNIIYNKNNLKLYYPQKRHHQINQTCFK